MCRLDKNIVSVEINLLNILLTEIEDLNLPARVISNGITKEYYNIKGDDYKSSIFYKLCEILFYNRHIFGGYKVKINRIINVSSFLISDLSKIKVIVYINMSRRVTLGEGNSYFVYPFINHGYSEDGFGMVTCYDNITGSKGMYNYALAYSIMNSLKDVFGKNVMLFSEDYIPNARDKSRICNISEIAFSSSLGVLNIYLGKECVTLYRGEMLKDVYYLHDV